MSSWFESAVQDGVQRVATRSGYAQIRQDAGLWRETTTRRATHHQDKARALSLAVARQRPINEITVYPAGRQAASYQRDAQNPQLWMAVAGRARGSTYEARVAQISSEGRAHWLPLVDTPGVQAYPSAELAMEFALEAAHQRMERATEGSRARARRMKMERRSEFATAIAKTSAPRVHHLRRNEIRATQMLGEIGFTATEIGKALHIDTRIVADICEHSFEEADRRWAGAPSYKGKRVVQPRITDKKGPPDRDENERRATTRVKADGCSVAFTVRWNGRIEGLVPDRSGQRSEVVTLERETVDGRNQWQACMAGRRLGRPGARVRQVMQGAITSAREAMAGPAIHVVRPESVSAADRAALTTAAQRVPAPAPRKMASQIVADATPLPGESLDRIQAADAAHREGLRVRHRARARLHAKHESVLAPILGPRQSTPASEPGLG